MSRLQIVRVNGLVATAQRQGQRQGGCPAETLAEIGIFRELAPDVVASLSRRCRWRRYGAGQTILQYQDEGRDVFFVLQGRVCAVYYSASGREVRFSDIPAGELFGEFAA